MLCSFVLLSFVTVYLSSVSLVLFRLLYFFCDIVISKTNYLFYLYRDNAQKKCCAKVSYKVNLHLQSRGRMLLQHYNIK